MSSLNENLLRDVMSLPTDLRTKLVDMLIESLNIPTQKQIDELWAEEAERRIDDLNAGKVKLIPGEQVFEEIRNRY